MQHLSMDSLITPPNAAQRRPTSAKDDPRRKVVLRKALTLPLQWGCKGEWRLRLSIARASSVLHSPCTSLAVQNLRKGPKLKIEELKNWRIEVLKQREQSQACLDYAESRQNSTKLKIKKTMKKTKIIEIAVKMLVAALTAFITALTTTSCTGYGPF